MHTTGIEARISTYAGNVLVAISFNILLMMLVTLSLLANDITLSKSPPLCPFKMKLAPRKM